MARKTNLEFLLDKMDSVEDDRSMFAYLNKDIPASIVVFLVALPLCLGIALASGAPLASGLISGIIGGLVIGYLSKSGTSVSGPAASVSAIAFSAISSLGSFELFLVALLLSGLFQIGLGVLQAGLIADYMPTSIIKGLLAGIGLILIISQVPYAFGLDIPKDGLIDYSADYIGQASEMIPRILSAFSPGAIIISVISMATLIYWEKTPLKNLNWFPASLFVVVLGVFINFFFQFVIPDLYLTGKTLVTIPDIDHLDEFFVFPQFSGILNFEVWTTAVTIAVVASIATLLNVEATDNLDPHKRKTPPNRELIAQGVGNTLSGLIGGIPITSVIVRSSVNINAGAETKLSTILHGVFLLASVLVLSSIINLIPLSSLAAILILTGYKLVSIETIKKLFKKGYDQFIPFVVTVLGIVVIGLLEGILIGSGVALFYLLKGNYHNPFFIENTKNLEGDIIRLELSNEVSFLNKASIKNTLWSVPRNSNLVIDATFSSFIDKDVLEIIEDYKNTFAKEHNINFNIVGLKEEYRIGDELSFDKQFEKRVNKAVASPKMALELLKEGNRRYFEGTLISRRLRNKEHQANKSNNAYAVILACLDLKESLNVLMDTGIGDLITMRFAGNTVSLDIIKNLEIAIKTNKIKLIVLMGNSGNSIIGKALEDYENNQDSYLSPVIKDSMNSKNSIKATKNLSVNEKDFYIDGLTKWNLNNSKEKLLKQNKFIKSAYDKKQIGIVTAFFDRETGRIDFDEM